MKHPFLLAVAAFATVAGCAGEPDPSPAPDDTVDAAEDVAEATEADYAEESSLASSDFDQDITIDPAAAAAAAALPEAELDVDDASDLSPTIFGGKVGRPESLVQTASVSGAKARLCSATLVGKRTILTAFHCIGATDSKGRLTGKIDPNLKKGRILYIANEKSFLFSAYPGVPYTVASVVPDPSTKNIKSPMTGAQLAEARIRDVALVRLTASVRGAKFAKPGKSDVADGTKVTLAGYGREDDDSSPSVPWTRARAKTLATRTYASPYPRALVTLGPEYDGPGGHTFGDSGGPMYRGKSVIGVHSFTAFTKTTIGFSVASFISAAWVEKGAR